MQSPALNKLLIQYCLLAPAILVIAMLAIHWLSRIGENPLLMLIGNFVSVPLFLVPMLLGCHMISKAYTAGKLESASP